ncbi:MAG: hypothetical protein HYZ53_07145 [Planctomycetes bacterium]|nr:hypothetical protein [Planctomycetota bacterium]
MNFRGWRIPVTLLVGLLLGVGLASTAISPAYAVPRRTYRLVTIQSSTKAEKTINDIVAEGWDPVEMELGSDSVVILFAK